MVKRIKCRCINCKEEFSSRRQARLHANFNGHVIEEIPEPEKKKIIAKKLTDF